MGPAWCILLKGENKMGKIYSEEELRQMGMDTIQIRAILATQKPVQVDGDMVTDEQRDVNNVVHMHQHNVEVHTKSVMPLIPTTISQIASYKEGTVVELPPFADGQPFVARMVRPSMLALVKTGKIPNSLLNQATSLFANGTGALNTGGKNSTNVSELFDVIDVIVEAALLEPTLKDIRSVGMELTDDQLMAIFSYTQRGVKALEQFRTERTDT